MKSIEKDLADALLLRSSTLALGLVEKRICDWAPELASLDSRVDSKVYTIYLYSLESNLESRLSDWLALEPRPRPLLPPNPMPKWNSGAAMY